jgi:hypothetical protein
VLRGSIAEELEPSKPKLPPSGGIGNFGEGAMVTKVLAYADSCEGGVCSLELFWNTLEDSEKPEYLKGPRPVNKLKDMLQHHADRVVLSCEEEEWGWVAQSPANRRDNKAKAEAAGRTSSGSSTSSSSSGSISSRGQEQQRTGGKVWKMTMRSVRPGKETVTRTFGALSETDRDRRTLRSTADRASRDTYLHICPECEGQDGQAAAPGELCPSCERTDKDMLEHCKKEHCKQVDEDMLKNNDKEEQTTGDEDAAAATHEAQWRRQERSPLRRRKHKQDQTVMGLIEQEVKEETPQQRLNQRESSELLRSVQAMSRPTEGPRWIASDPSSWRPRDEEWVEDPPPKE